MLRNVILFIFLCIITHSANAQTYIGITGDFGNRIDKDQLAKPFLKSPIAPSGSIVLTIQKQIKDDWFLQYGGRLGTLGFMIRVSGADTLSSNTLAPALFEHYETFF